MIRFPKFRLQTKPEDAQPAPLAPAPKLSAEEAAALLAEIYPQAAIGKAYIIEQTAQGYARVRMVYGEHLLRPGGTISGPSMFALADLAMYAAVLATHGPETHAATVNLNITFLRRPGQRDMIGEARLLKLGRRLAMGEVALHSDGVEDLAAHATSTYALPV
jgi:uncharacterized protein (TIGR00369 family)